MREIVWTRAAEADLQALYEELEQVQAGGGEKLLALIDAKLELLKQFPEMAPDFETPIRRLLLYLFSVVELVAPATSRAGFSGARGTGRRWNRGLFVPPATRAGLSQARQALPLIRHLLLNIAGMTFSIRRKATASFFTQLPIFGRIRMT